MPLAIIDAPYWKCINPQRSRSVFLVMGEFQKNNIPPFLLAPDSGPSRDNNSVILEPLSQMK